MNLNELHFVPQEGTIGHALAEFQRWLATTDLKPSTKRVYSSRLRQLYRFIDGKNTLLNEESAELPKLANAFLDFVCAEQSMKPNSLNNFITMFRLMADIAGIDNFYLSRKMSDDTRRVLLSDVQQELYINAASMNRSGRDHFLVLLLLKTNIRLGEAINLKVSDLVWEQGEIGVCIPLRKGRRVEVLSPEVSVALRRWLRERSFSHVGANSEYIFHGARGEKITSSAVDAALRKVG
ncbi:MAG: site-specific integrase, partial [Cyanobacteria bacterium]|nr:site-specific integrase [Cyanobacteriota bacterium]